MRPKISVTVAWVLGVISGDSYRVISATNTTDHRPGDTLKRDRLDGMIRSGITVKVVAAK